MNLGLAEDDRELLVVDPAVLQFDRHDLLLGLRQRRLLGPQQRGDFGDNRAGADGRRVDGQAAAHGAPLGVAEGDAAVGHVEREQAVGLRGPGERGQGVPDGVGERGGGQLRLLDDAARGDGQKRRRREGDGRLDPDFAAAEARLDGIGRDDAAVEAGAQLARADLQAVGFDLLPRHAGGPGERDHRPGRAVQRAGQLERLRPGAGDAAARAEVLLQLRFELGQVVGHGPGEVQVHRRGQAVERAAGFGREAVALGRCGVEGDPVVPVPALGADLDPRLAPHRFARRAEREAVDLEVGREADAGAVGGQVEGADGQAVHGVRPGRVALQLEGALHAVDVRRDLGGHGHRSRRSHVHTRCRQHDGVAVGDDVREADLAGRAGPGRAGFELQLRLGDIEAHAEEAGVGHVRPGGGQRYPGVRRGDDPGGVGHAGDLPVGREVGPRGDAGPPAGQFPRESHVEPAAAGLAGVGHGVEEFRGEPVGPGDDGEVGGVDADRPGRIDRAGGREGDRQQRLGQPAAGGVGELAVLEGRGAGRREPAAGPRLVLQRHLRVPAEAVAAQVDEVAQAGGQAGQIDVGHDDERVGRAAPGQADELGLALQLVERRPQFFVEPRGELRVQRLLPGEFLAGPRAAQGGRRQAADPLGTPGVRRARRRVESQADLALAQLGARLQPQHLRRDRGELGQVEVGVQLEAGLVQRVLGVAGQAHRAGGRDGPGVAGHVEPGDAQLAALVGDLRRLDDQALQNDAVGQPRPGDAQIFRLGAALHVHVGAGPGHVRGRRQRAAHVRAGREAAGQRADGFEREGGRLGVRRRRVAVQARSRPELARDFDAHRDRPAHGRDGDGRADRVELLHDGRPGLAEFDRRADDFQGDRRADGRRLRGVGGQVVGQDRFEVGRARLAVQADRRAVDGDGAEIGGVAGQGEERLRRGQFGDRHGGPAVLSGERHAGHLDRVEPAQ